MMKVMIDPGHGGNDVGAFANNVKEKDLNLEVALCLEGILKTYGIDAKLTRYHDTAVSLKERCDISNLFKANLFISIHHNAANGKAKGYEIYHATKSINGKRLAELVEVEFSKLNKKRYVGSGLYGGSKEGDYYVLKHTNAPAILTEFCFVDNLDDLKLYDPHAQANALAIGILNYFGIEIKKEEIQEHYAESIYKELTEDYGLTIHEKRFDDRITRAETMALILQALKNARD